MMFRFLKNIKIPVLVFALLQFSVFNSSGRINDAEIKNHIIFSKEEKRTIALKKIIAKDFFKKKGTAQPAKWKRKKGRDPKDYLLIPPVALTAPFIIYISYVLPDYKNNLSPYYLSALSLRGPPAV